MKKRAVVLFFSIVLTLYGAINLYIFLRGWSVVPALMSFRIAYSALFLFFSLSFIAGRFLERIALSWVSATFVWMGSFWLAAMVYLLLFIATIDILRLLNFLVPFFPVGLAANDEHVGQVAALFVAGLVALIVVSGHINALVPRVKTLALTIHKNSHPMKTLNIVAVSDIHLGTIISKKRLQRIVQGINSLDPDLVLLPGDVIDEDIGPVIKQNLGETLRKIQSRFGVIAITGNHEYIGGVDQACRYLVEHGITVLRDEITMINGGVYIVGREDRSVRQFLGKRRRPLGDLLVDVDPRFPIIVMDHQPFRLEEAADNGVDLQLSGHTHHGQLWPFNFITRRVYELSWGYTRKKATHVYVSCGVGTWGPPVRTGNRPEIVNIRLTFA